MWRMAAPIDSRQNEIGNTTQLTVADVPDLCRGGSIG
jgi:hypothetical protein